MAHHVHCHIHYGEKTGDRPTFGSERETDDAGTAHDPKSGQFTSGQHMEAASHHREKANQHLIASGRTGAMVHRAASGAHGIAAQKHATASIDPSKADDAHKASKIAEASSQRAARCSR